MTIVRSSATGSCVGITSSSRSELTSHGDIETLAEPPHDRRLIRLVSGGSQSVVSLASFSVSFLVLLALVPVLVRALGARNYGAWVLSGGIANYVLVFDFGLSLAVTRFVALNRKGPRDRAEEAITAGLVLVIAIGALIVLVTALVAPAWESYLEVDDAGFALRAGGIATVFVLVSKIFQSALEGAGMVSTSRIIQAIGSIVFVVGGIAVVLTTSQRLQALSIFLIAQTVAVCAALSMLLFWAWGGWPLRWPSREGWRRVLAYALTMQGSAIFVAAVDPLSRFLVVAAAGPAAVAPVDVALRARSQLFGSALAFTRPFLPELGALRDAEAAATRAGAFWRRFAPVAIATGLFVSVASYFVVPALLGSGIGESAGRLTTVVSAMWIPAITAIIPYLFLLLYGLARDILVVQALNSAVGIGLMAGLLSFSAEWAPIVGLGCGSIIATLATVRIARRRGGRGDLFRLAQILSRPGRLTLVAPIVAGAAFFLPGPLYVRSVLALVIWTGLLYKHILRLVRDAG